MDSNIEMSKVMDENNEKETVPSVLYKRAVNLMNKGCYREAITLYEKAAVLGSIEAQSDLAYLYLLGAEEIGIKPHHPNALKWFRKLAEQGDEDAEFQCDYLYYHGLPNSQEAKEATDEMYETVEVWDAPSYKLAGQMCYFGEGVKQDIQQGIEYFKRAAEQGDVDALLAVSACLCETGSYGESLSYLNKLELTSYALMGTHKDWIAEIKFNLFNSSA